MKRSLQSTWRLTAVCFGCLFHCGQRSFFFDNAYCEITLVIIDFKNQIQSYVDI